MAFPMLGLASQTPHLGRGSRWTYEPYVLYYAYIIKLARKLANRSSDLSSHLMGLGIVSNKPHEHFVED